MGISLVTPATEEPVTREQVKDHLRIHRDVTGQDLYLDQLTVAARGWVELYLRKQLLPATWRLTLDRSPSRWRDGSYCWSAEIWIPRPPLIEITSVRYRDSQNDWQTLDAEAYEVSTDYEPGKIYPVPGTVWPTTAIGPASFEVVFKSGYRDRSKVPQMICVGILEIVRMLFDGVDVQKAGKGVCHLLYPFRCLDERVMSNA